MPSSEQGTSLEDFAHFLPEVSDKIQAVADTYLDSYNEHFAFGYLIAELFETTQEDKFLHTDGPKDGGVDFLVRDQQAYSIAQCKCPELDRLDQHAQAPTFDDEGLKDLEMALNMLADPKGDYDEAGA